MQKRQCSFSRGRALGARCVAALLQPFHSQHGASGLRRRSWLGLTRMRSNKGESDVMTEYYAELAMTPSSLDRRYLQDCHRRYASIVLALTPAVPLLR